MDAENQLSVRRNVALLYGIYFFIGMIFWYGIEKIFLTRVLHFGPSIIAYIVIVYGVIQITLNVPTGVLADRWSRKGMIVVSLLILLVATYILGTSSTELQYLIGTFGWGLYLVCITGSLESLLYDGLKQQGAVGSYKKLYGRLEAAFMLGIFLSSSLSGYIARWYGIRWAYYVTLLSVAIAAGLALMLVEPTIHKVRADTKVIPHMIEVLLMLKKSAVLTQIVIMSTMLFLVQTAFYEYAQLYYIALFSASVVATGIANGSGGLSVGIGGLLTKYLRFTGVGFLCAALLLLASMGSSHPVVRVMIFMLFGLVFGAVSTNINNLKHSKIPSPIRATLSSAISTIDYIIVIPLALVFSRAVSHYSIFVAYRAVAVIAGLYFVFYWFYGRQVLSADQDSAPVSH